MNEPVVLSLMHDKACMKIEADYINTVSPPPQGVIEIGIAQVTQVFQFLMWYEAFHHFRRWANGQFNPVYLTVHGLQQRIYKITAGDGSLTRFPGNSIKIPGCAFPLIEKIMADCVYPEFIDEPLSRISQYGVLRCKFFSFSGYVFLYFRVCFLLERVRISSILLLRRFIFPF